MTTHRLDINPRNLEFEFSKAWTLFEQTPVKAFLTVWLAQQAWQLHVQLESVKADELPRVQGELATVRKMQTLLEKPNVEEQVTSALKFLNDYARKH